MLYDHRQKIGRKQPYYSKYEDTKTSRFKIMSPYSKAILNSVHIMVTSFLLYQYIYNSEFFSKLYHSYVDNPKVISSVYCSGSKSSDRICRFENLCYSDEQKEFVFLRGEDSVIMGLPGDRFEPPFAELSSVEKHNLQYFHYTDVPDTFADKHDSIVFIKEPTLLFNRFFPSNLMHVFHDDLMPIYATKKQLDIAGLHVLFLDRKPQSKYSDLYDILLGNNKSYIEHYNTSSLYCFKDVRVGVVKDTTWYQYGFHSPQGPIKKNSNQTGLAVRQFRDHFLGLLDIPVNGTLLTSPHSVLLTRKHNRLITNEAYMMLSLSKLTKRRTHVMNLEKHSVVEIIRKIHDSGMVIGMHGSLMVLSVFLPPGSAVIELFPYAVDPKQYTPYKTLAGLPGLHMVYKTWKNVQVAKTVTYPDRKPELGGIAHLPKDVQKQIKGSTSVPPHTCCYDPEWLFRIYQDTNVDLKTFGSVVEEAIKKRNELIGKLEQSVSNPGREIAPAHVRSCSCASVTKGVLQVKWGPPWNLKYLNNTEVKYEIWVQQKYTDDVKAYILKATAYEFQLNSTEEYLLWVRCIRNEIKGPFTQALSCTVK